MAEHGKFQKGEWGGIKREHVKTRLIEGKGVDYNMYEIEEGFGTLEFTSALTDAAHVSMMKGFGSVPALWREVSNVVSRNDFKTNHVVSANGMGLLEKRQEKQPTTETKPTDRKESYAVFPYDRKFGITMEAQANDVTGALMQWFKNWGVSSMNTLNWFMFDQTNGIIGLDNASSYGNMSDGEVLFSASHSSGANYGTGAALNFENLEAKIAAMLLFKDNADDEYIFPVPKKLVVPPALTGTANRLVNSDRIIAMTQGTGGTLGRDGDRNTLKDYQLQVVTVPHLEATEWILSCDPATHAVIEMGFYQGKTEPTVMIQGPDSDAEFNTRTRYAKAMLVFGGAPCDWRTISKWQA